jgi:hypothetical protein
MRTLSPAYAPLKPGEWTAFYIHVEGERTSQAGSITVSLKEAPKYTSRSPLPLGIDLGRASWHVQSQACKPGAESEPPADSAGWTSTTLPARSTEKGVTWLRTRFTVPASWQSSTLRLRFRVTNEWGVHPEPVIDAFLNGTKINPGERSGVRDQRLTYRLPSDGIRWGQINELHIGLEQSGRILREAPFLIIAGDTPVETWPFPEAVMQSESQRAAPSPVGPQLPLRPLAVRDGILRYPDGKEVALWGVNYYPQSWEQYESLRRLGVDPRRSIDEDLEDFVQTGINIIRIHVFDTEISDANGNLVLNDHLNVLDYLVAQCDRKGIYLMLTTMAWWISPSAIPDSFSRNIPKEALSMWPATWPIQANYIRQFLTHTNPYTGRRLVDEPCLVLFEVLNEPAYFTYRDVVSGQPNLPGETTVDALSRGIDGIREAYRDLITGPEWRNPVTFAWFRYQTLHRYINTMIEAIRSTGAKQPIAYSSFYVHEPEIAQAVADSHCDALTVGAYPGGLSNSLNDNENLLGWVWNNGDAPDLLNALDARFAAKARLVYEFDAACMIRQVIMYPYLGQFWRNLGVQVACQFQYDAKALAAYNWAWPPHYLNLWHTPEKMVSFLIGAEVFRRLPRGMNFELPPDDEVFPPGAVSFHRNAALLCADDCYMQARPTDWRPMHLPEDPTHVMSVGSCPYFEYEGNGVVDFKAAGNVATLQIYPDVERPPRALTGDPNIDMVGTRDTPLTVLREHEHPFHLRLPRWDNAEVERFGEEMWTPVDGHPSSFTVTPGTYRFILPK